MIDFHFTYVVTSIVDQCIIGTVVTANDVDSIHLFGQKICITFYAWGVSAGAETYVRLHAILRACAAYNYSIRVAFARHVKGSLPALAFPLTVESLVNAVSSNRYSAAFF